MISLAMFLGQFVKREKMMDINVTADDLALLTRWDTPTICNALEEIIPERRGYGFYHHASFQS